MDFIIGLPKVQGKDFIYVVVDRLTKFAHFYAISTSYTATHIADLFFREVFRLHGLPKTLMTRTANLWVTFGKNYLDCVALFWLQVQVTTHKQMAKQK